MKLSGWGRYPTVDCRVLEARGEAQALAAIEASPELIARGAGRSYGDAALNSSATLCMRASDRFIAFDSDAGVLTCEAGVLLADITALLAPRGWFTSVSPGTKFVTVGGMIAADVHGKNHHRDGSFGAYVDWVDLALADGAVVRCSRDQHAELFAATLGGMGLTGVILRVSFRLRQIETKIMRQRTVRARNLDEALSLFEVNRSWTYSVGWIDCLAKGDHLGRSLIFLAEHARRNETSPKQRLGADRERFPLSLPFDAPEFALNRASVGLFNESYYRLPRPRESLVGLESYFYPLDAISGWNRLYGKRGFVQYQCVLPKAAASSGLQGILRRVADLGTGSFLAVLKLLGPEGLGMLSFPMEGYTLALDFAVNQRNLALLAELDAIVADHGGRIYLAKDARAPAGRIEAGYPRIERFRRARALAGGVGRFESAMSRRLSL